MQKLGIQQCFLVFDEIKTIKKQILTDCKNPQEMSIETEQEDEENSLLFGTLG